MSLLIKSHRYQFGGLGSAKRAPKVVGGTGSFRPGEGFSSAWPRECQHPWGWISDLKNSRVQKHCGIAPKKTIF